MRKAISVVTLGLALLAGTAASHALDKTCEYSVQASAAVQASPPQITLSWPQDRCALPKHYTVFRKAPADGAWALGTVLPGSATSYVDTNVTVGTPYEYQVVKSAALYTGYGYVCAGIELPITEIRGKLVLAVDNTFSASLSNELAQLHQDLVGDGWSVIRINVSRDDSVANVKALIRAVYNTDPSGVHAVFLFGHVPVPYSGNIVPDGHAPDHQGAWPCDGYYGDMDGVWTDSSVNFTRANEPRNRNVPGDGKFDQSTFPAPIKLMVGRVDLSNMPGRLSYHGPATFPAEVDLLRNYLDKDHKFRTKQFDMPRCSVVGDYFGERDGEAFAASGWRNFAAFFGPSNVTSLPQERTWIPNLGTNCYLWAYGCGAGTYTSIGGFGSANSYNDGTTTDLVRADAKAVFTLLFGSWLGDWDCEDDMLRSVLATPSFGLTAAWSGRPHWFLHPMALGAPIGFCARLTQNNGEAGVYQNQVNNGAGQIHIALMGDPTLRMHIVAPPTNLGFSTNGSTVSLKWEPSTDSVLGYHVYSSAFPSGPYVRLTSSPLSAPIFTSQGPLVAQNYMVRAVKLETSASGSYYNLSQGAFLESGHVGTGQVGPLLGRAADQDAVRKKVYTGNVSALMTNTPAPRTGPSVL
jgi:hypothetical protein